MELPAFLSLCAMIRAHVEAASGHAGDAQVCPAVALAYLQPARVFVLAIGGLPGTGKPTSAQMLAPGLGRPPGALVLHTDEIRKRQSDIAPEMRARRISLCAAGQCRGRAGAGLTCHGCGGRRARRHCRCDVSRCRRPIGGGWGGEGGGGAFYRRLADGAGMRFGAADRRSPERCIRRRSCRPAPRPAARCWSD